MTDAPQTTRPPGSIRIVAVTGQGDIPDIPLFRMPDNTERLLFARLVFATEAAAETSRRAVAQVLKESHEDAADQQLSELVELHMTTKGLPALNLVANEGMSGLFKLLMSQPIADRGTHLPLMEKGLQHIATTLLNVLGSAHGSGLLPWMRSISDVLAVDSISTEDTVPADAPAPEAPAQHPRHPLPPIVELRAVAKVIEVLAWRVPADEEIDPTANYTVPGWVLQSLTKPQLVETLEDGDYLMWGGHVGTLPCLMSETEFHQVFTVKAEEVPQG